MMARAFTFTPRPRQQTRSALFRSFVDSISSLSHAIAVFIADFVRYRQDKRNLRAEPEFTRFTNSTLRDCKT